MHRLRTARVHEGTRETHKQSVTTDSEPYILPGEEGDALKLGLGGWGIGGEQGFVVGHLRAPGRASKSRARQRLTSCRVDAS